MSLGERVLVSLGVFVAAGGIGWAIDYAVRYVLHALARRTHWVWSEIVAESLRGHLLAASILGGGMWISRWWEISPTATAIVDKFLAVAALFLLFSWIFRFSVRAVRHLLRGSDGRIPAVSILANVVRISVVLLAASVILQTLGIPITPLLTALGIGGLAIALALQDTLSNLFAGLHLLAARQVRPNDFVQLDSGHEGVVEDINWRTTTIRTLANNLIIVPNSRLANTILVNYRLPQPELSLSIPVTVVYGSDLERVEQVTLRVAREVLREVSGGIAKVEPVVRFRELGDTGIHFVVVLQVARAEDQSLLRHEFIKRLYAAYRAEGIEIPSHLGVMRVPKPR